MNNKRKKTMASVLVVCMLLAFSGTAFAVEPVAQDVVPEAVETLEQIVEDTPAEPVEQAAEEDAQPVLAGHTVDAILVAARTDGARAAQLLNALEDADYTAVLKQVLDIYYEEGLQDQLAAFTAAVDTRAADTLAGYGEAAAQRQAEDLPFEPGEVLVMFEQGVAQRQAEEITEDMRGAVRQMLDLTTVEDVALVEIPLDQTVEQAVEAYEQNPAVRCAQPNFIYTVQQETPSVDAMPNDPLVEDQWYFKKIETEKAWMILDLVERERVRVAVLDTPADLYHEDLKGVFNIPLCVDTMQGEVRPYIQDIWPAEHGTHVSGTIGALANNGIGVAGIASGNSNQVVDLVSVGVMSVDGYGNSLSILVGIDYAIGIGAKVINMSLGGSPGIPYSAYEKMQRELCDAAYKRGITVVAAAGNNDSPDPSTPSDFRSVISVIATMDYDDPSENGKAEFSNYGPDKDFSAPGEDIVNTIPSNEYDAMDGTSMATPIVSGVIAMMLYVNPNLQPDDVYDILKATSTDLYTGGFDIYTGWGEVNAYQAVMNAYQQNEKLKVPATPKNLVAKSKGPSSIELSWDPVEGADGYAIYRSMSMFAYQDLSYVLIGEVDGKTSYTDSGLIAGKNYHYKVAAKVYTYKEIQANVPLMSERTEHVTVQPRCVAPQNLTAKGRNASGINVSWSPVASARGYYVYRSTRKDSGFSFVKKLVGRGATTYKDSGLTANKKYYYKVFAYSAGFSGKALRGVTAGPVAGQTKKK